MKPHARRPIERRRNRPAFTLLELTAASVLAALLLAGLLATLRCVARQKRMFDAAAARRPGTQLLAEQLRRDVIDARFMQSTAGGLRLVGLIAQDHTTRVPTGRLADVTYRVAPGGGLVRRESHLDQASDNAAREEPVWSDVSRLEVVALESTPGLSRRSGGLQPVPPHLLVAVYGPQGQPILRMPIRHHWEDR